MATFFRWSMFTLVIALLGLGLAFSILFLSRLYVGLQSPAFVFAALVFYSGSVTIAAINFASKLEDEAGDGQDVGGALRLPSRAIAEGETLP